MSWLHYLIEANIYLGVFYLCYCLFLNRDTHYTLGRVYLIFSCVIAFILPLTQLSILKSISPETVIVERTPQAYIIQGHVQQVKLVSYFQHFTVENLVIYLYITGAFIAFVVLLFRLRKLYILTSNNPSRYQDKYKLVNLTDENTAFSFFNYLFIGSNVPQSETVIAHEMVHIRQKHSVDIIFLEILKVINWFNPFIYLTQRSLKTIHEYIADEQTAAREQDALTYSSFLLNNAYGIQGSSIAHSFFNYNLLKKRIIMLNKNRSGKLARLKYLAALPLCAGMLCTSTLVFSKDYGLIDLTPLKSINSTKYALKLTDVKHNISGVKQKGYDMSVVERKNEFADTIKRKLPPPPPAPPVKFPKTTKVPQPPVVPVNVKRLPPPPPEPPTPPKNKIDKIKFPPPVVKPDRPAKAPKISKIKFPPAVGKSTFSIGMPPAEPAVVKADVAPTAGRSTFSIGTAPAKPAVVKSDVATSRQDTIRQRK